MKVEIFSTISIGKSGKIGKQSIFIDELKACLKFSRFALGRPLYIGNSEIKGKK
jgi:hypothetical protein